MTQKRSVSFRKEKLFFLVMVIALLPTTGGSQEAEEVKEAFPPAQFVCLRDEIHTQMDFALGYWEITYQDKTVGDITLEKDARGCMVKEKFTAINGYTGAGIDYYDPEIKKWRRILVVSNGTVESFEGGVDGDKFIWEGREVREDGSVVLERVEMWREGSIVINNIFQSYDNGETWQQTGAETRVPKGSH